ncbi:tRNA (adenosine(37)-N6)-threonylcarbamoyltransferase complex ATPase subunit type 1 TsaE [Aequoribacter sp.]|uniref:tRNA (adenosine(37)-N6)-threonylcarbamoyltransferase complex ATPase subunit type 1 TsaE n=1 Tax=Aequoribacter sp. TaxID=2847771 RepID=UPI003C55F91B
MVNLVRELQSEEALLDFGQALAACLMPGLMIELRGELGAGKTTLSRAIIQCLGHKGAVKSPTYTLVEPYEHIEPPVYHFDLYRIADPDELHHLGVETYFNAHSICLVEWPERGVGFLPKADIVVTLEHAVLGRRIAVTACSDKGRAVMECLL